MYHHLFRNYRIISVMFWAFPYLLWQASGHWSGFVVGVIVAIILTVMLNDLFYTGCSHSASSVGRRSFQRTKSQPRDESEEQYCMAGDLSYAGELRSQHEEMQVVYPQEQMPPKETT